MKIMKTNALKLVVHLDKNEWKETEMNKILPIFLTSDLLSINLISCKILTKQFKKLTNKYYPQKNDWNKSVT